MTWTSLADSPNVPRAGLYQLAILSENGEIIPDPRQFSLGTGYSVRSVPTFSAFTHWRPWFDE